LCRSRAPGQICKSLDIPDIFTFAQLTKATQMADSLSILSVVYVNPRICRQSASSLYQFVTRRF
jgi:hypothetical protein